MTKPLWMLVREAFERKNYFPPSSELRDELVGIAIDYAEQKTAATHAEIKELKRQLWNMTENAKALADKGSRLIANLQEGEFVSATREQEWLEALRALKGDNHD